MNILDAAYNTVHDYKGGASALAPRMGIKSPAVLNSKVNPNTHTHHITLLEAVKLMEITGDYRILQEYAPDWARWQSTCQISPRANAIPA